MKCGPIAVFPKGHDTFFRPPCRTRATMRSPNEMSCSLTEDQPPETRTPGRVTRIPVKATSRSASSSLVFGGFEQTSSFRRQSKTAGKRAPPFGGTRYARWGSRAAIPSPTKELEVGSGSPRSHGGSSWGARPRSLRKVDETRAAGSPTSCSGLLAPATRGRNSASRRDVTQVALDRVSRYCLPRVRG